MIYIYGRTKEGNEFYNRLKNYFNCEDSVIFLDAISDIPKIDCKPEGRRSAVLVFGADCHDKEKLNKLSKKIYYAEEMDFFLTQLEFFVGKPILPYVETHVNDHCNLNCKGCGHMSNIAPKKFANYDKFEEDIKQLRTLFSQIKKVRLMGGEPFLNPHLAKFAELIRKVDSDTDIHIVTNGLFFGQDSNCTLKRLADLGVRLDISSYPPTIKRKKDISEILDRNGVNYRFTDPIGEFFKFRNPCFNRNVEAAFEQCHIKMCTFLREGKMSVCSFPILYSQLDTFMKDRFLFDDDDIIDIYDPSITGWKIAWRLTHSLYACRYCRTERLEFYAWESGTKTEALYEDWFVEDENGIKD